MSKLLNLITGEDNLNIYCDPGTALVVMGIGALVGAVGSVVTGYQEKELAEDQAEHNEEVAGKQYGFAKDEATTQLEQLREEETTAKSGLLQGAAHAGVKIERDEIQAVDRAGTETLIAGMEKGNDYTGGTVNKPRSTIEALSGDISKQITDAEKGVMRNLSNAKLGLDDALFNAGQLREQGKLSVTAGWFNAGSTLLTSAGNIYAAGKSPAFNVW